MSPRPIMHSVPSLSYITNIEYYDHCNPQSLCKLDHHHHQEAGGLMEFMGLWTRHKRNIWCKPFLQRFLQSAAGIIFVTDPDRQILLYFAITLHISKLNGPRVFKYNFFCWKRVLRTVAPKTLVFWFTIKWDWHDKSRAHEPARKERFCVGTPSFLPLPAPHRRLAGDSGGRPGQHQHHQQLLLGLVLLLCGLGFYQHSCIMHSKQMPTCLCLFKPTLFHYGVTCGLRHLGQHQPSSTQLPPGSALL